MEVFGGPLGDPTRRKMFLSETLGPAAPQLVFHLNHGSAAKPFQITNFKIL